MKFIKGLLKIILGVFGLGIVMITLGMFGVFDEKTTPTKTIKVIEKCERYYFSYSEIVAFNSSSELSSKCWCDNEPIKQKKDDCKKYKNIRQGQCKIKKYSNGFVKKIKTKLVTGKTGVILNTYYFKTPKECSKELKKYKQ